jgi:hypothetical protein
MIIKQDFGGAFNMVNMQTGGNSNPKMIKATGTGTDLDPFVIEFSLPAAQITQLIADIGGAV